MFNYKKAKKHSDKKKKTAFQSVISYPKISTRKMRGKNDWKVQHAKIDNSQRRMSQVYPLKRSMILEDSANMKKRRFMRMNQTYDKLVQEFADQASILKIENDMCKSNYRNLKHFKADNFDKQFANIVVSTSQIEYDQKR